MVHGLYAARRAAICVCAHLHERLESSRPLSQADRAIFFAPSSLSRRESRPRSGRLRAHGHAKRNSNSRRQNPRSWPNHSLSLHWLLRAPNSPKTSGEEEQHPNGRQSAERASPAFFRTKTAREAESRNARQRAESVSFSGSAFRTQASGGDCSGNGRERGERERVSLSGPAFRTKASGEDFSRNGRRRAERVPF